MCVTDDVEEHDQIINQLTDDNQLLVQRLEDEEAHVSDYV